MKGADFMNKALVVLSTAGVLVNSTPVMTANAAVSTQVTAQAAPSEDQIMAAGLISRCNISVASSSTKGILYINGTIVANSSMKSIGYKDIVVQYSTDGKTWYKEKSIDDLLKSNSISYYLSDYSVSVKGGYYYRVTCTHYAKESGFFGSSQSVDSTSNNSVWINKAA